MVRLEELEGEWEGEDEEGEGHYYCEEFFEEIRMTTDGGGECIETM